MTKLPNPFSPPSLDLSHILQTAVIDTIVAMVQGIPGDDRCVLLLGYPEPMEVMMREANPGLARRFQLKNAWVFDDYNDEELMSMLRAKALSAYGWDLDFDVARAAIKVCVTDRVAGNDLRYGKWKRNRLILEMER